MLENILNFENQKIDHGMNTPDQINNLVTTLYSLIENNIEGDVVELGCYVGESSKYLMKTLVETNSRKSLFVYDSFEGLPDLSKWEENTGWKPRTLNTSEEIFIQNFKENNLPLPIIHKDWFKNIPEYKIPNKICFAFLDGDFYDSIFDSLTKIYDRVVDGGVIFFHDYLRPDLPGVDGAIRDFLKEKNIEYNVVEVCNQLGMLVKHNKTEELSINNISESNIIENKISESENTITIVTGLWDIGRDKLNNDWSRNFSYYLEKFNEILKIENNLIIFGDETLQKVVMSVRDNSNTQFILRSNDWFKDNDYYEQIQKIRNSPEWINQVGWLKESTQAQLDMYNPLVMSKVFLLNDAKIMDKFDSDFLFWLDAGITNTVHPGYFTHDKVLNKLPKYIDKFSFLTFHYDAETEVHGFNYEQLNKYAGNKVNLIGRGGFFGGPKDTITNINNLYYSLLIDTLNNNLMGTEESLFSILLYKYPTIFNYFEIESNGLVNRFFEDLKNDNVISKQTIEIISTTPLNNPFNNKKTSFNITTTDKVGLYVIGFNSPKQLETLIISMLEYDKNFIEKPRKILLDNSSDLSTTPIYSELCSKYGFEHIKKDNLGICGGRQWIAEHFEKSDLEHMFFFEDDMFFYPKKGEVCRNGFNRMVDDLYNKSINISRQENFDFLKLNFSEFFGDNSTQWTWYNVPQSVREQYWPDYSKLPEQGTDPNAPKVKYENVKIYEGIPYVTGEIYYCNWPQLVSKSGSKKMFLDTTWAHPYEQTWMSHMFQELKKDKLNFGLLLLTPTEHDRFDHYSRELRKES
jgi:O-methyltransferase